MHIGEEDSVIPPEKLESIKKAQAGAHIFTYPKGSHGFDNQARPKYDAATVKLARERTLEFLSRHVG
jgi:carboxymethylenebutenolidase